jgi:broad specificity phosphatase PhoE
MLEAELPDLPLLLKWRDDPTAVELPGGEPLQAVHDRAVTAMREIVAKHEEKDGLCRRVPPGRARAPQVLHLDRP